MLALWYRQKILSFVAFLKDTQLLCVVWWDMHGNNA